MKPTRRTVVKTAGFALAAPAFGVLGEALSSAPARAQEQTWRHGASLYGDLYYPAGFAHFDYVNPAAPKTGVVRLGTFGTYDNFNPVIAGLKGIIAGSVGFIFESLTTRALDEVESDYGLIAEAISYPPDFAWAIYRLRREARWHDGVPITPEDVVFSFEAFKANNPQQAAYYRHVVKAEKTGEREVTFRFDGPGNRELPQIIGQLMIVPKHWWEGTDASGRKRDVTATTLEPPLGSGPYRIREFVAGRSVVLERVKDAWAVGLNVNVGQNNFDEVRYDYFRDATVALEAFKADQFDWRRENIAKNWATAYDFPAVREKRVVLEEFPIRNVGILQGFVFNARRDKFKDPRVRRAFNFAYDFEEMNRQLFYGQYRRIASYFDGTELAWNWRPDPQDPDSGSHAVPAAPNGLPTGLELEILESVRDKVPAEVFTTPYFNPVGGAPEAVRANLREALRLLKEAGYEVRDTRLVATATGEPFNVEILLNAEDPSYERIGLFYKSSYLERLGVNVSIRSVDLAQYENRLRQFDFDVIFNLWAQSLSPGNEQRDFWGSPAADTPGSQNYAGIRNPAVDALIERIIFAKRRDELVATTRALDRVLLWNHYLVPLYYLWKDRAARWDRFGRPAVLPRYGMSGFPTVWWWDAERAAKAGPRP
ncbi:MAG TPA: extracellular solute-binding protein [Xanthobacteraceae bacterium]|nr:extracellular solute-binding protein [Xanthobacteraceae bacterium]